MANAYHLHHFSRKKTFVYLIIIILKEKSTLSSYSIIRNLSKFVLENYFILFTLLDIYNKLLVIFLKNILTFCFTYNNIYKHVS